MQIKISHEQIEMTDAIKAHAEEKFNVLTQYMDGLLEADVWLGKNTNHHAKGDVFECKVNVSYPGGVFRAESTGDDLYNVITDVKKKLKEQIISEKERQRDH